MSRRLTWRWELRRVLGLPAICPACLHPECPGQSCNWRDDPPLSGQWEDR